MSSMQPIGLGRKDLGLSSANVLPLFACPGAKEVTIQHAVFPHGSGFSEMKACPARAICVWYASHDYGGEFAFNEQPQDRLLGGNFQARPFRCTHFQSLDRNAGRSPCTKPCRSGKRCARK